MEIIKKVISLEKAKTRAEGVSYGTLTATSFYFKVHLTQNIDDMGMFTDYSYIPSLNSPIVSDSFSQGDKITGFTDSKLEGVRGYNIVNPYIAGFDVEKGNYLNYSGGTINGVSRVTNISGDSITYVFDAKNDLNIGTSGQTTGILYSEDVTNDNEDSTFMSFMSEGWNTTNTSLSAISKQEYLMGIINPPEVKSDVFIDRGVVTVMESHLRLSEVETLDHLVRYGNGFYNIVK